MQFLKDYCRQEEVETIVVGEPRQPNGQPSENLQRVKSFVGNLKKEMPGINIVFYDERFTSVIAHRTMIDAGLGKKARQNKELVDEIVIKGNISYDRSEDKHFDNLSAFMKSLRGSDPDAAVFYLAKLLEGGDIIAASRRLLCSVSEDVGLAYPQLIPIVKAAVDSALQLGMPEARLPLVNATILIATAPKSNSAYMAYANALEDIHAGRGINVPRQLQNTHFDGKDALVKGQNYKYPHDYPNHWVNQQYLPDDIKDHKYYVPGDNKMEKTTQEYWSKIKK